MKEYLGDGLYADWDGYGIKLSAPREDTEHWVYLEPDSLEEPMPLREGPSGPRGPARGGAGMTETLAANIAARKDAEAILALVNETGGQPQRFCDDPLLHSRFGGLIRSGSHSPDSGEGCAFEQESVRMGIPWTDDPEKVRCLDFRDINDGPWSSDQARTEAIVPLMDALRGSLDWPNERRWKWVERVAIRTVREIIAELPKLPDKVRRRCRNVTTLDEAVRAVSAAEAAEAAVSARMAARMAARWVAAEAAQVERAAALAADAAVRAALVNTSRDADTILRLACRIWIESAQEWEL